MEPGRQVRISQAFYGIKMKDMLGNKGESEQEQEPLLYPPPLWFLPLCLPPRSPHPASDFLHLLGGLYLPLHHPAPVRHKHVPLQNHSEHVVSACSPWGGMEDPSGCHVHVHSVFWGILSRGGSILGSFNFAGGFCCPGWCLMLGTLLVSNLPLPSHLGPSG